MNDDYQAGDSTAYAGMAQICQLKCIVRKHKYLTQNTSEYLYICQFSFMSML